MKGIKNRPRGVLRALYGMTAQRTFWAPYKIRLHRGRRSFPSYWECSIVQNELGRPPMHPLFERKDSLAKAES